MLLTRQHVFLIISFFVTTSAYAQEVNSVGMKMLEIPAGTFQMGAERTGEDADESPAHAVTLSNAFRVAATEVTNRQYELFDPAHRKLRGKSGFSKEDDEAVVFVNYPEAVAFCAWLSRKEGKTYRLPTEAEWEYACRGGTQGAYFTGDTLPAVYQKSQKTDRVPVSVSLQVAQAPPNAFGLYDTHGNVEEWCYDWYGPYEARAQKDPVGRLGGLFRVTRGGSHGTPVRYLRSANRQGMIPEDKHWLVGFRVVQADWPNTKPLPMGPAGTYAQGVSQQKYSWKPTSISQPIFKEPMPYVKQPTQRSGVPFYAHNHCPAISWCANGDVLAIWFSTNEESGREMTILASRRRAGQTTWDEPSEFFKVPDRNMTGSALLNDQRGTLYHLNGVEASGDWQNLAMVMRKSTDNGATWSKPSIVAPEHAMRHQVIAGTIQTREGWLIQACDAVPGPAGGTAIYISKDQGKTWSTPYTADALPKYLPGASGGLIAGIHAGVVQRKDGALLAFGRNNDLMAADSSGVRMPMSISENKGKSWWYLPSEFPPINSGQRLVVHRLKEGPLLFISFTNIPGKEGERGGMMFTDGAGKKYQGYGMFAALSFDEGKTWPVKKLLTDGKARSLNGGAWTGTFQMDATHAEPKGYLALTQTPDGIIHLLSSSLHYQFNLAWLKE